MELTFSGIEKLRVRTLKLIRTWVGEPVSPTTSLAMSSAVVKKILPDAEAGHVLMLLEFEGQVITSDDVYKAAELIAGWARLLSQKRRPFKWAGTPPAWHMFTVMDIYREVAPKFGATGKLAMVLKPVSGPSVGDNMRELFPVGMLWKLLREIAGAMYDLDMFPEDLFGMSFKAAALREGQILELHEISVDSGQRTRNRKLVKARQGECLHQEITHLRECGLCWLGQDQCPKSRHRHEWKYGQCLSGGHHAPLGPQGYCAACMFKERRRK
jgi:hypothetical protein